MSVHRNIRLLAWLNFWSGFRPYAPIAILYFSQIAGSYAAGMSIYSVATLAQSLFEVPTGVISDRVGRKQTVVFGAIAAVLSLLGYALGGSLPGGSYLMLLIGGVFEGLAHALYSGNNDALLYDSLMEDRLAENRQEVEVKAVYQEFLGKTASAVQGALAISAFVGSLIAAVSFSLVMWLSVIPMLLAFFTSLRFSEPQIVTHQHPSGNLYAHLQISWQKLIENPRLRIISLASIIAFAVGESAWLIRSAFIATLWPVWALGIAQMIANSMGALGFYFAGRVIRRFGELKLLIGGPMLNEGVNLIALAFPTVLSPFVMSLSSVSYGINNVAVSGLMQREFTDEQRATMGSLTSLGGSIAFAVFSLFLGALADRIGIIAALMITAVLLIIPMILYWWGLRGQGVEPQVKIEAGGESV